MEESSKTAPIVGRITYAYYPTEEYTDAESYLKAIREELPYMATTGMRLETLTREPEIRKAVDDFLYDYFDVGDGNPRSLEDYQREYQKDGQKPSVKEKREKER